MSAVGKLKLTAFVLIIIALARPSWNPHYGAMPLNSRDLVIALDISRSMLAADVFPNRLDAAKITILESLDFLRGQRVGLITFAGAASVRVPLTLDHHFVRYMLNRANPDDADVGSTSVQSAIEKAIDIAFAGSERGRQDLIVFTDGEDHISHIEKTAEQLRDCGARVLIIGIGDPVNGAKVPDGDGWMQYQNEDVVTRLDEQKLLQLAGESPNVIYFPARTRPFDLPALYRKLIQDTANLPSGANSELIYTEGWSVFIALALFCLLLAEFSNLLRKISFLLIGLLFFTGCEKQHEPDDIKNFIIHYNLGCERWNAALVVADADPHSSLPLLLDARNEFLRAALFNSGDVKTAEQIAGLTTQIRTTEAEIRQLDEAEQEQQQELGEIIKLLQELTRRESELSRESQQLLNRRPPVPAEERARRAGTSLKEQTQVHAGTGEVLNTIAARQNLIQTLLKKIYGEDILPPTEFDTAVTLLIEAIDQQQRAGVSLAPENLNWTQANASFRIAASRMSQALDLLTKNSGAAPQQNEESDFGSDRDFDDDTEWEETDGDSQFSMPMNSAQFKTSLENKTLPVPNYTAEEILTEEAANQQQRSQQQAARAGAGVEKNW